MEQVISTEAHVASQEPRTFEEFLQQYDDAHAEWVNGEVMPLMPASVEHQDTNMFLLSLVVNWVAYYELGRVYHPPLLVKLPLPEGREVAREPDIVVILNSNAGRFEAQYFDGAPDLIVEIVSPASRHTDRFVKFEEYETAGVPEYWVVDPDRRYAEFFQRDGGGLYRVAFSGSEGVYRSRVLDGFWLEVDWLWSRPPLWSVLKQLGLG
ncbi:MAG: Uma2 family endonuclease [Fimbriimonadales bacterium]|nr:MAG: restriction endonuclease [Fimbriimonadales bacterium]